MAVTNNTPQALTRTIAAAIQPRFPYWTVVSDIAADRETTDDYIVLHAGEATPVPGVPASNCTMRLPLSVIAIWQPADDNEERVPAAQFVEQFNSYFAGILGKPLATVNPPWDKTAPGWVLIDYQPGFPVVGTDGVCYSVTVNYDLVVQF